MPTLEIPFAEGDEVWACGHREMLEVEPCCDCAGTGHVIVETATGRFEVPCGACSRGWEGATGKQEKQYGIRVPERVTLSAPRIDSSGVYYFDMRVSDGQSGTCLRASDLFSNFTACHTKCVELMEAARKRLETINWERAGRGRTEAARKASYYRQQIQDLRSRLEYYERQIRELKENAHDPEDAPTC